MAAKRQGPPLAVRFSDTDLEALNQAAALTGRSRNSLVVEGARIFARMALSAAHAVSADNADPRSVLAALNSTAGAGQSGQDPEGEGDKGRLEGETKQAVPVSSRM